jgi:hypothetical protein
MTHVNAENDTARDAAVRSYDILGSAPEIAYDEIAEFAAQICGCPAAYISFIEGERLMLKAKYSVPLRDVPLAARCGGERTRFVPSRGAWPAFPRKSRAAPSAGR